MNDDLLKIDGHKLTQHPIEVARWLQAGDDWEAAKTVYPIYVEISPFGGCNFRCSFCAKDFLNYENIRIAPAVLKSCLKTMAEKGVKSVYFAGEGEPLLYKELGEIIDFTASCGLHVALNTNASVFNKSALVAAVKNCRWIRASINAGNAKEHGAIHDCREDIFERVMGNLKFCADTKAELQSSCIIGAQAVLLADNRSSMLDLARLCREAGADYLTIKPYSQHPESITRRHEGTDYSDIASLAGLLEKEQTDRFKIYCRPESFERSADTSLRYGACFSVPNFWAYIRSNGDVSGCNAFLLDKKFRYGNINEAGFEAIWEGPGRKAGFDYMKTHDISRCRINCRMDKVNQYLWSLKNPALHDSFI